MNTIQSSSPYEDESVKKQIVPDNKVKDIKSPEHPVMTVDSVQKPPKTEPARDIVRPKPQTIVGTIAYNKDALNEEQKIYMNWNENNNVNRSIENKLISDQLISDMIQPIQSTPVPAINPPVYEYVQPEPQIYVPPAPVYQTPVQTSVKKKGNCCMTWLIVIIFFFFLFLFSGLFLLLYSKKNFVPVVTPFVEKELQGKYLIF